MPKPGSKEVEPSKLKRITDYVSVGSSVQLEGRRLDSIEDILGQEVELVDFVIIPSKQYDNDFAVMQFNMESELVCVACGGVVIVDTLKQMPKNYLPVAVKIIRIKGKSGRKYLSFE